MGVFDRFRKPAPAETIKPAGPAREAIVPVVLDAPSMARQESLKGKRLAKRHVCADLWTVYSDTGRSPVVYLSEEDVSALSLSAAELHALALANLEGKLPGVQRHGDASAEVLTCGGGWEPSLLLFAETWDAIAEEISGDVVACVPSRDRVMFTGSAVPGGVERVRAAAEKVVREHREPCSSTLLWWRGDGWAAWPTGRAS